MNIKKYITFAAMKSQRKILFKIILFLTVFISIGIDPPSKNIQTGSIEIPVNSNKDENFFSSDNDPIDEDQIDQNFKSGLTEENICLIPIPRNFPGVYNFSFPVWQPPKLF